MLLLHKRGNTMQSLSIIQYPVDNSLYKNSCLYMQSRHINFETIDKNELKSIIGDLFMTLYSYPSGVGLAANQVGLLINLCVIDIKRDANNPIVLINPKYYGIGSLVESKEVCLSFPNNLVTVKRYNSIRVEYYNIAGELISEEVNGFKAFVFQHEIDHLNGIPHISNLNVKELDYCAGRVEFMKEKAIKNLFKCE